MFLLALTLCIPAAQQPLAPAQRQWMEVQPNGVFLRQAQSTKNRLGHGTLAAVTAPRWQVDDLGLAWIGQNVAVGDSGAWILASKELNNESVAAYPTGANQALFDFSTLGSTTQRTACAARSNLFASLVTTDQGGFQFQSTLYAWDTDHGAAPLWTATLPNTGNVMAGMLAVSDDGSRVVAAVSNTNGTTHVRGFQRDGTSLFSYDLPAAANIRYGAMDAAGNRLYLGLYNGTCGFDELNTGVMLHTQSLGGSFDSHAFSADGTTFAYGNFTGLYVVRETTPGVWSVIASRPGAGGTYLGQCALNQDGSRCGFIEQRFTPAHDHLLLGLWDVNANTAMFTSSLDAPGTSMQLIASGMRMDAVGDYLAGISWGDSLNLTPEVFVYDASGNLTASLDTPGSAFGLALDADGDVVVAGTKAVHANTFGNGGSIFCVDAYEQNLHVLGYPRLGHAISLETPGGATSASFAVCQGLAPSPSPYGTTEVDLQAILTTFGPVTVPPGGLFLALNVPSNPALLGTAMHFQGVRFAATNVLTNKVSLRFVP